ncbi:transporter substrate-binding domain-containing protein [Kitasatospora sp. NPDC058406]|uniref:transporter substrate-binding domain-containing protein n=1 Tax=Kitasatospora sp. NPDC058406 TaxID=3346483 RepID=UPI00364F8B3F
MTGKRRDVPAIRATAVAALLALTGCGGEAKKPLLGEGKQVRVGVKSDQPGTGLELHSGEFVGLDVTVARELLERVNGGTPFFDGVLSKNRAPFLRNETFALVVATYSITEQRMRPFKENGEGEGLDFVGPYASGQQGVLVRADDRDRFRSTGDLDGKLVCVWRSTTSASELNKPSYSKVRLSEQEDAGTCVKELKEGRVDAVSTDQLILYGFMEAEPTLAVVPEIAFGAANDYGVALAKGHRKDCEILREAMKKYAVSNEWDRDFQNNLPKVPLDTRNEARPTASEIDALSCRDGVGNAAVN